MKSCNEVMKSLPIPSPSPFAFHSHFISVRISCHPRSHFIGVLSPCPSPSPFPISVSIPNFRLHPSIHTCLLALYAYVCICHAWLFCFYVPFVPTLLCSHAPTPRSHDCQRLLKMNFLSRKKKKLVRLGIKNAHSVLFLTKKATLFFISISLPGSII